MSKNLDGRGQGIVEWIPVYGIIDKVRHSVANIVF